MKEKVSKKVIVKDAIEHLEGFSKLRSKLKQIAALRSARGAIQIVLRRYAEEDK